MAQVSIIIPFYNDELYAKRCVESVCKQTYSDLEIILINDGSTDGTPEILESLAKRDSRIKLLHKANDGVSSARNTGIRCATGTYLTFIDGDDYISENYIEELYHSAINENADMVICGITFVSESGDIIRELLPGPYIRGNHEEWTFRISATCSHFYRKELWDRYNIAFSEKVRAEDLPVALFFSAMASNITTIHNAGYYYVQRDQSARHQFKGLKKYDLPYQGMDEVISFISHNEIINSKEFHELFVLRILTTFFFELGMGSSRLKMVELKQYIYRTLHTYYPSYITNKKKGVFTDLDIPFYQKVSVCLFCILVKTRLLSVLAIICSRKDKN